MGHIKDYENGNGYSYCVDDWFNPGVIEPWHGVVPPPPHYAQNGTIATNDTFYTKISPMNTGVVDKETNTTICVDSQALYDENKMLKEENKMLKNDIYEVKCKLETYKKSLNAYKKSLNDLMNTLELTTRM